MRLRAPFVLLASILCLPTCAPPARAAGESALPGYAATSERAERQWEERFRAVPSSDSLREYDRRLSARPHPVGSEAGKANAEWIEARMKEWGLDAQLETFYVLFPTPAERVVELLEPRPFVCRLEEPPVPGDPATGPQAGLLPTYNAYSVDGDVTAPLVYVNHGIPEDYEQLDRMGISVRGAVVIARYGGAWRGVKPKLAAEHGAVGCLIYSDPREDGYFAGDTYPDGPFRPAEGVQRGSVMDMAVQPGDPLTPGMPALFGARRLPLKDARSLTRVPVMPLSWADARPLLAELRGPVAPEGWRGALPLTYHVGPGPAKVHLKVAFHWDIKPVYDVVARIPGGAAEDEWVIRGNHHDAWVCGAQDPVSGLVALLEEARAYGQLLKAGWKPRRTILLCAWDGEEPGLMGSTEWTEAHSAELREHAALYVNSDSNGRGFLDAGGSPSLEELLIGAAGDIPDPETGLSVGARAHLRAVDRARTPEERRELRARTGWPIGALGSGSDYSAFLDHEGVACLNLGFGGEDGGGVYHSAYDDFTWYTQFADSGFAYGRALARTAGTLVMRAAGAELLPLDFRTVATRAAQYVDELDKSLAKSREDARENNRKVDEGCFAATADPRRHEPLPAAQELPPELDFSPLRAAVDSLRGCAGRFAEASARACAGSGEVLHRASLSELNQRLLAGERALADRNGLPGRPWYRNLLYAPGVYTGYGAKTLPGVREAIEQRRWDEARAEIRRAAVALTAEAVLIEGVTRELEP